MILFYIWVFGCFINCYIINKDDEQLIEPHNYRIFDFRVNIILDILKSIFIFSSFIGTLYYFIKIKIDKNKDKKLNADN